MDEVTWQGIFPSIPTPFTSEGAVDLDAQRQLVRFAVDHGAHGIICFGLAGEVLKLAADERKQLCDVILEEANGLVPVLVGVGAESEHAACDLARYAERAGADGVVLPPPVNARASGDVLARFLTVVADTVSVPVMLQDAPEYLGVELGPELVLEVAGLAPQVSYVKLEIGPDGLARWVQGLEGTAAVFGGNGGLYMLDCIRAGAAGIAPGLELVDLLVAIYESELAGDSGRAERLFKDFLPMMVFEMQDLDHYNACAKYVLSRRGVQLNPGLRSPALQATAETTALLDTYLEALPLEAVESSPAT